MRSAAARGWKRTTRGRIGPRNRARGRSENESRGPDLTSGLPVMLRMSCIPQMPTAVPVAKKSGHTSGRIHRFDHDPAAADAIVRIGSPEPGGQQEQAAGRQICLLLSFVARKTRASAGVLCGTGSPPGLYRRRPGRAGPGLGLDWVRRVFSN